MRLFSSDLLQTAPGFLVTHRVREKQDTLAIVEKDTFLKRVAHIMKAMPDFSWNYKGDGQVDKRHLKVKVQLRKSGCHTGEPFGPPGTGLQPVAATEECFITGGRKRQPSPDPFLGCRMDGFSHYCQHVG